MYKAEKTDTQTAVTVRASSFDTRDRTKAHRSRKNSDGVEPSIRSSRGYYDTAPDSDCGNRDNHFRERRSNSSKRQENPRRHPSFDVNNRYRKTDCNDECTRDSWQTPIRRTVQEPRQYQHQTYPPEPRLDLYAEADSPCPMSDVCGGCRFLGVDYNKQLNAKQRLVEQLLKKFGPVEPIMGMQAPIRYRNKVEAVFGISAGGKTVFGKYRPGSHTIVPISDCLIEDKKNDAVIADIADMMPAFGITPYDEKKRRGMLRHVLVRRGFATNEIMVVPVMTVSGFKTQKQFAATLVEKHPEIKTIVISRNDKRTSMVLGQSETVIYGKGFIENILCGYRFRISAASFYQVNPIQTEKLYNTAIEFAGLTGNETVLDAYCGTGTIAIAASKYAHSVLGAELNPNAVKDAAANAARNNIRNCRFICADAGRFMMQAASEGQTADVLFMDPPRSGSDKKFLSAVLKMRPNRIVYVSCNPTTLARDLDMLTCGGFCVRRIRPVDMFPHTEHVETVVLLKR